MVSVALAGTAVTALLMAAVIGNLGRIRAAAASVSDARPEAGSFARIMVTSAPVVLALYLLGAWFYWLAHWLERGQHRLKGRLAR